MEHRSLIATPAQVERDESVRGWANGYNVNDLKRITTLFERHDEGQVHGHAVDGIRNLADHPGAGAAARACRRRAPPARVRHQRERALVKMVGSRAVLLARRVLPASERISRTCSQLALPARAEERSRPAHTAGGRRPAAMPLRVPRLTRGAKRVRSCSRSPRGGVVRRITAAGAGGCDCPTFVDCR
jgi:hypothetical protein